MIDLEDLVMMDKVGDSPLAIHRLTTVFDRLGHGAGAAGEDAHLAHIAVLLLDKLEEGAHVGPSKMVDRLQPREHAAATQPLEVILADVEHRGAQVELVEELGDEDVNLQHPRHVLLLHVPENIFFLTMINEII